MSSITTIWLGLALATIALVNLVVVSSLSRSGSQPETTPEQEPRPAGAGLEVSRILDLASVAVYAILLTEMVPRIWQYSVDKDWQMLAHAGLAILLGLVLLLRLFRPSSAALSGWALVLVLATAAFVMPTAWRVQRPLASAPADSEAFFDKGRMVLSEKCGQCHGLRTIACTPRSLEEWKITAGLMQGRSKSFPNNSPFTTMSEMPLRSICTSSMANNRFRRLCLL